MRKRKTIETFEVVEDQLVGELEQWFVIGQREEYSTFESALLVGCTSAEEVAHIVSRWRQTGVLVRPHRDRISPGKYGMVYREVGTTFGIIVVKASDILYRIPQWKSIEVDGEGNPFPEMLTPEEEDEIGQG